MLADLPADSPLSNLDNLLRKIWLKCCGHLSEFSGPGHSTVGKAKKLSSFLPGDQLLHTYDFGSSTETLVTILGDIKRKPKREAVRLLARNIPPRFSCAECGSPAELICPICKYSSDSPFYCAACGEKHEHSEMLLPVTNSPRMGECGYEGSLDTLAWKANDRS